MRRALATFAVVVVPALAYVGDAFLALSPVTPFPRTQSPRTQSSASFAPVAHAHLGHVVLRAERYLKLDVAPGEARIVVSLSLGGEETRRVLGAADTDASGDVTPAEAEGYLAAWGAGLQDELPMSVDGTPVSVRWEEPYLSPQGPVTATQGTVEMIARVPLEAGVRTLSLTDHMRGERFDRTDVAFEVRSGAELLASGLGAEPARAVPRIALGPAKDARVITMRVRVPPSPDARTPPPECPGKGIAGAARWPVFLVAGFAVAAALGAWWARRRRR